MARLAIFALGLSLAASALGLSPKGFTRPTVYGGISFSNCRYATKPTARRIPVALDLGGPSPPDRSMDVTQIVIEAPSWLESHPLYEPRSDEDKGEATAHIDDLTCDGWWEVSHFTFCKLACDRGGALGGKLPRCTGSRTTEQMWAKCDCSHWSRTVYRNNSEVGWSRCPIYSMFSADTNGGSSWWATGRVPFEVTGTSPAGIRIESFLPEDFVGRRVEWQMRTADRAYSFGNATFRPFCPRRGDRGKLRPKRSLSLPREPMPPQAHRTSRAGKTLAEGGSCQAAASQALCIGIGTTTLWWAMIAAFCWVTRAASRREAKGSGPKSTTFHIRLI